MGAAKNKVNDPVGRIQVKRRQESVPTLISVIFSFLLCLSKATYHWSKSGKGEKNCQSVMSDEEQLNPHGVRKIYCTINKQVVHIKFWPEEELSARITNVLTKFQSISD